MFFNTIYWAGLSYLNYGIVIILFVMTCLVIKWLKLNRALRVLVAKKFRSLLLVHASTEYRLLKTILFFVGISLLVLALFRPQWDKKEEVVEQEGRDVLIALDISRSMLAQDEKPNRLEFAKKKIRKLLYNLSCERVGLILFSGTTVLQCPLTMDYGTFFMFLDQIDAETISSGTTTIDGAIRQALAVFSSMKTKKTKLLCMFTDGEDFSTNLSGIKDKAKEEGLAIFTFGIGSEHGAPIPIVDAQGKQIGFEKDAQGNIVMSKLNVGILKNLSEQTGGRFIHATTSDTDIKQFISFVSFFEKDSLEDKSIDRLQEKYHYFVLGSFICLVLEWLL